MTIGRIPSVEGGIQPTIVDAKGDLIAATAADTVNRLAVGSNDQVLVADSSTSTGLAWKSVATPFAAGKNRIINGDFNINQRAFTSTTSLGYGFDRWLYAPSGATGTYSSQSFTLGTAPVSGYEGRNFARLAVTTGNDFARLTQLIESVRTFAGQTVTVSFWAKGTNPTTAGNLKTSLSQVFGTGGSPSATVDVTEQTFVLTANWTRYSFTFSVPSISGKTIGTDNNDYLAVNIGQGTSTSSESWTLDLWGVQVEAGNVATAFQTATGTLQGELAACQRYYYRANARANASRFGMAQAYNTTNAIGVVQFPVTMRTAPSALEQSGTASHYACATAGAGIQACTAVPTYDNATTNAGMVIFTVGSGLVGGNATSFMDNSSNSAYLAWSAEL